MTTENKSSGREGYEPFTGCLHKDCCGGTMRKENGDKCYRSCPCEKCRETINTMEVHNEH